MSASTKAAAEPLRVSVLSAAVDRGHRVGDQICSRMESTLGEVGKLGRRWRGLVEVAPYDGIVRDLLAARIVAFELSGVHEHVSVRQFAELTWFLGGELCLSRSTPRDQTQIRE